MVAKAGSYLLAAAALAVLAGAGLGAGSARAQNVTCVASPNGPAPAGTHWYYKTDQTTHQKCWYTRPQDQAAQAVPAQTAPSQTAPERGDAANPGAGAASAPQEAAAPVPAAPAAAPPPIQERTAPAVPRRTATAIARVPVPAADPRGEQPITTAATPMPSSAAVPSAATAPGAPDDVAWPAPPVLPQTAGAASPFPPPPPADGQADASSPPGDTAPASSADPEPAADTPTTAAATPAPDTGSQPAGSTAVKPDSVTGTGTPDKDTPNQAKPPGRVSILLVMAGLIVLLIAGMLLRWIVENALGQRRIIKLARQEPRLLEPVAVPPPMPTMLRHTPSVVPDHTQTEQRATEVEDALRKLGQSLRQRRTAVNGLTNDTTGRRGAAVRS